MNLISQGIFVGRYFGIAVRLHFTFLLYAFWRIQEMSQPPFGPAFGIAYVAILYLSVLLHEFGHALAARWCDGQADEILLWPLGGLAFCLPPFNATAHLITTAAGPLVSLALWLASAGLLALFANAAPALEPLLWGLGIAAQINLMLLLFNMIPAFPMDGGRLLRDLLWHWLGARRATEIAVWIGRFVALAGMVWAFTTGNTWLVILAAFVLLGSRHEPALITAMEASGRYEFSIRERLARGRRQRQFREAMHSAAATAQSAFHRCAVCHRSEQDGDLDFRTYEDGREYCIEHLPRKY